MAMGLVMGFKWIELCRWTKNFSHQVQLYILRTDEFLFSTFSSMYLSSITLIPCPSTPQLYRSHQAPFSWNSVSGSDIRLLIKCSCQTSAFFYEGAGMGAAAPAPSPEFSVPSPEPAAGTTWKWQNQNQWPKVRQLANV